MVIVHVLNILYDAWLLLAVVYIAMARYHPPTLGKGWGRGRNFL